MKEKQNRENLYLQPEVFFFPLWKYANAERLEKRLINFNDLLSPLKGEHPPLNLIQSFLLNLAEFNIELEDISFNKDIFENNFKNSYPNEYKYIKNIIKKYPKSEFSEAFMKAINNSHISTKDVYDILGERGVGQNIDNERKLTDADIKFKGISHLFSFSSSPSKRNINPLKSYLDKYLKGFIDGNLKLSKGEVYKFSKQKEILLYQLKNLVQNYGLKFKLEYDDSISYQTATQLNIKEKDNNSYLFIHTLAALEKQNYFKINSIKAGFFALHEAYLIKLKGTKKLLNTYKEKDKPAQKYKIFINENERTLKVGDYKIDLSRAEKQFNTMKVIIDNKLGYDDFTQFSQVMAYETNSSYGNKKLDNRYYQILKAIEKKIQIKTKIDDNIFITHKHKFKFNTDYINIEDS